jgi:outer membrane protein assembly factor BamB
MIDKTKRPLLEVLSWIAGIISAILAVLLWLTSRPVLNQKLDASPSLQKEISKSDTHPRILWSEKIGAASWRNNPIFIGQYLYVGSSGSKWNVPDFLDGLYAFDSHTGKKIWFISSKSDVNDIAYIEGMIVAGNDLGELIAVSAISGDVVWRVYLDGAIYAKAVYSDSGIVVGGSSQNFVESPTAITS